MTFTVFSCKDPEPEPGTGVENPTQTPDNSDQSDETTQPGDSDSDKEDSSTGGGYNSCSYLYC